MLNDLKQKNTKLKIIIIFTIIASSALLITQASSFSELLEPENGTLTDSASKVTDNSASNGQAVMFGNTTSSLSGNILFEWFDFESPYSSVIATVPLDGSETPRALTEWGKYRDWGPHPSPDGQTILFKRDKKGHLGSIQDEVWLMDPDGSNQRRIMSITEGDVQNNPNNFIEYGHHEWENDGNTFVFSASGPKTKSFAIWRMNADGTDQQQITSGDVLDADPSVCPDGRILFARRPGISHIYQEIWIMNPDGTNQIQLTDDVVAGRDPKAEWDIFCSPNGERAVFLRQNSEFVILEPWDNFVMDIDGGNHRIIADGSEENASYGVVTWVDNSTVVSSRAAPFKGFEIIKYNVDNPSEKTVIVPSTKETRPRNPIYVP